MAEPQASPRITCLSLAVLLSVAGLVAAALVFGYLGPRAGSWTTIAAAALAAVAVFIIARRLKNVFWAVIAALVLAIHPSVRQPASDQIELLAQSGMLAGLAAVAGGWHLAFQRRFAWRLWPLLAGAMVAAVGLTAAADFLLGLLAALLAGAGLLPAAVLARLRRLRYDDAIPGRLNVLTALATALLTPVAGIYLCRILDLTASEVRIWESIQEGWQRYLDQPANGLSLTQLNRWCWPTVWVMAPLLAWAWWRSLRRGWRDWRTGQPPTAWLLTVLALVAAATLVPRAETAPLVLVALAVLLLVFWMADVWKGTVERLILLPPEEERGPRAPATEAKPDLPEPEPSAAEAACPAESQANSGGGK